MNSLLVIWRALFTRSPQPGDSWLSRVDRATVARIIGVRDQQVTFVGPDDVRRTWPESEFVCLWRPLP